MYTMSKQDSKAADLEASMRVTGDSSYDNIDLPEDLFETERTQRIKINCFGHKQMFKKSLLMERPYISNIKSKEKLIEWDNDAEWAFEKGFDDLKIFFNSFPYEIPESVLRPHWDELGKAMAGNKAKGWYPVTLILATRR